MSLSAYSYSVIGRWAAENFPTDYRSLPNAKRVVDRLHKTPGFGRKGHLCGLVIGTTHDEYYNILEKLAWLDGKRMIVGYVSRVDGRNYHDQIDSNTSIAQGDEQFTEPFSWAVEGRDDFFLSD